MTVAKADKRQFAIAPPEILGRLPEVPFDPAKAGEEDSLCRAELLQSVLAIAELDHMSESELVRRVVKNALGKLPELEE